MSDNNQRASEFSKHHKILVCDNREWGRMFSCRVENLPNENVSIEFINVNNLVKEQTNDGEISYYLRDVLFPHKNIIFTPTEEGIINVEEYDTKYGVTNKLTFINATKACEFLYKHRDLVFDNLQIYGELFSKYLEIKKEHESQNEKV